jgi:NADH:ubiquinone oxidoreductase subunit 6 (subunit J)
MPAGFINPAGSTMYIVAIAWMYVVVMMTVAEANSANGTLLGALFTFILYGVLPVAILVYLMGSPARKRKRRAIEAIADAEAAQSVASSAAPVAASNSIGTPDSGDHAPGDAVAAVRKEP